MNKKTLFPTIARFLLGGLFFASGFTGLLHMTPKSPPTLPPAAIAFNTGLEATGYMMPLIFTTLTVGGGLLLANRFVPLALALLAPFVVNSAAFHFFLVREGMPIVVVMVALEIYLAWSYREAYKPMLKAQVTPNEKA